MFTAFITLGSRESCNILSRVAFYSLLNLRSLSFPEQCSNSENLIMQRGVLGHYCIQPVALALSSYFSEMGRGCVHQGASVWNFPENVPCARFLPNWGASSCLLTCGLSFCLTVCTLSLIWHHIDNVRWQANREFSEFLPLQLSVIDSSVFSLAAPAEPQSDPGVVAVDFLQPIHCWWGSHAPSLFWTHIEAICLSSLVSYWDPTWSGRLSCAEGQT